MKFLVLALCVCAASAAVFKPYNTVQTPVEVVGIPNVSIKTVEPVVHASAKAVYSPLSQVTAKAVYHSVAEVTPKTAYKFDQTVTLPKNAYYSGKDAEAPIVRSDSSVTAEGFDFAYETGNGIAAQAVGSLKRVGDIDVVTSQGSYRYYAPDGTPVEVTYVADENGFQPQSNLLPVPPPVPEAILRSLAYNAEHAARKVIQY